MTTCALVGIPGSGKSTVGRELAKRLSVDFIDTDRVIERNAGKSVSDIFVQDGEENFRKLEKVAVLDALKNTSAVVSLGGGAVIDGDIRAALKQHKTFWLQTSIPSALRRTSMNQNRPLLLEAPRATLIKLLEQREGFYQEVARAAVVTDDKSIKTLVDEIEELLKSGEINESN